MYVRHKGLTLVETAIAMAILAITSIGALSYRYHSAQQIRVANAVTAATRIGQMVLEDWKSKGGAADYDPTSLNMGFTKNTIGDSYVIAIDGMSMAVWLDTSDVDTDAFYGIVLREVKCTVRWRNDTGIGTVGTTDPTAVFTTYVRRS